MKPVLALYLKVFLFMAIPFGLIMLLVDILDGNSLRNWDFLGSGIFFGISMSLLLVTIHIIILKTVVKGKITAADLRVKQKKMVKTDMNKEILIQKLKADPELKRMRLTETENGIGLESAMNWKSWGESIFINIKPDRGDVSDIEVTSRPKLRTTLVDFGKNLMNVKRIEKVLTSIS